MADVYATPLLLAICAGALNIILCVARVSTISYKIYSHAKSLGMQNLCPPKIVHEQVFVMGTCLEGGDISQLGLLCSNSSIKLMRCAIILTSCLTLMSLKCGYPLEVILIPTVFYKSFGKIGPEQNYCGVYLKKQ